MSRPTFIALRALWRIAKSILPRKIRMRIEGSRAAQGLRKTVGPTKYEAELGFWRDQYLQHSGNLRNDDYYATLVSRIAGITRDFSWADKIVIDIGCGPRGSLCWLENAKLAIGLDPLAGAYSSLGIAEHPMSYVCAVGEAMPFTHESIDIVITINALDHADNAREVMKEIRRVLKPGGLFIGSINLRRIPTGTEPSIISRQLIDECLLGGWKIAFQNTFPECDVPGDAYRYADVTPPADFEAEMDVFWCRAEKPPAKDIP